MENGCWFIEKSKKPWPPLLLRGVEDFGQVDVTGPCLAVGRLFQSLSPLRLVNGGEHLLEFLRAHILQFELWTHFSLSLHRLEIDGTCVLIGNLLRRMPRRNHSILAYHRLPFS